MAPPPPARGAAHASGRDSALSTFLNQLALYMKRIASFPILGVLVPRRRPPARPLWQAGRGYECSFLYKSLGGKP